VTEHELLFAVGALLRRRAHAGEVGAMLADVEQHQVLAIALVAFVRREERRHDRYAARRRHDVELMHHRLGHAAQLDRDFCLRGGLLHVAPLANADGVDERDAREIEDETAVLRERNEVR
jgi:hypothetical protein